MTIAWGTCDQGCRRGSTSRIHAVRRVKLGITILGIIVRRAHSVRSDVFPPARRSLRRALGRGTRRPFTPESSRSVCPLALNALPKRGEAWGCLAPLSSARGGVVGGVDQRRRSDGWGAHSGDAQRLRHARVCASEIGRGRIDRFDIPARSASAGSPSRQCIGGADAQGPRPRVAERSRHLHHEGSAVRGGGRHPPVSGRAG